MKKASWKLEEKGDNCSTKIYIHRQDVQSSPVICAKLKGRIPSKVTDIPRLSLIGKSGKLGPSEPNFDMNKPNERICGDITWKDEGI